MNNTIGKIDRRTGLRYGALTAAGLAVPQSRFWQRPKRTAHAMTAQGDLPDWQTLTTPNFQIVSLLDVGGGVGTVLTLSGNPFRIWQVWMNYVLATNATYALGGTALRAALQDGSGAAFLAITNNIVKASDHAEQSLSVPLYGVRPTLSGGTYQIALNTQATPANVFMHVDAGAIISMP